YYLRLRSLVVAITAEWPNGALVHEQRLHGGISVNRIRPIHASYADECSLTYGLGVYTDGGQGALEVTAARRAPNGQAKRPAPTPIYRGDHLGSSFVDSQDDLP